MHSNPVATDGLETTGGFTGQHVAAGDVDLGTVLNVRDILEARNFYQGVFGRHELSDSGSTLRIRLDSHVITLRHHSPLGPKGRVAMRYQLAGSRFAPVRHPLTVSKADWQAIADRLARSDTPHDIYAFADNGKMHPQGPRIAIVDPSGNALEIQVAPLDAKTLRLHRRRQWALRGGVAAGLLAVLVFSVWQSREPSIDASSVTAAFFGHLP